MKQETKVKEDQVHKSLQSSGFCRKNCGKKEPRTFSTATPLRHEICRQFNASWSVNFVQAGKLHTTTKFGNKVSKKKKKKKKKNTCERLLLVKSQIVKRLDACARIRCGAGHTERGTRNRFTRLARTGSTATTTRNHKRWGSRYLATTET